MSRWFRFYDAAVDDPKVQSLSGDLFKAWVNLLCVASQNQGVLPSAKDMAFKLRLSEKKVADIIARLIDHGLIDNLDGVTAPHNWDERQYRSDAKDATAAERMRRHRNKKRGATDDGYDRNTVTVTATEQSRAETEQNRTEQTPDVERDWTAIVEQACQAAGMNPGRAVNEISTSIAWAKAGYDPAVILKAVRQVAAKPGYRPPGSLAYFRRPIEDAHALKALPAPKVASEWGPAMDAWRKDGTWFGSWGPKPGEPGCRVPAELLTAARAA